MMVARTLLPFLLAAVMVHLSGCVGVTSPEEGRLERLSDAQLWQHSLQLRGKAEEELRCRGLSSRARQASMDRRFGARAAQVRAALLTKYGTIDDTIIPIGYRCPFPQGGITEYTRILGILERRFSLPH